MNHTCKFGNIATEIVFLESETSKVSSLIPSPEGKIIQVNLVPQLPHEQKKYSELKIDKSEHHSDYF
jgi:hypothetical protein